MDLPSRLDLYSLGRQYVLERAVRIDPKQVDVQGSDVNVYVGSQSVVAFEVVKQLGYSLARLVLDSCDDDDLDRYAWDRYQTARKGAAPALGQVTFTRPTAAAGAGTVPIGTKLSTSDAIEYVTTTPASFGVSDLVSSCYVRASKAGKASQVGKNNIRRIVSPTFDSTLTVNNDGATAGGEEREGDDDFRARIRNFWLTARRGTLLAIEFGALTVPGVVSAKATEVIDFDGRPGRAVVLTIADSSGVSNQALANLVSASLGEYRAGGIFVFVSTSVPEIVPIKLRLVFDANVDTVSLSQQVLGAVIAFVNSLPVNAPLLLSDLYAVLSRFRDDGVVVSSGGDQSAIAEPVGDVIPDPGRTIRTTDQDVILLAA